MARKKSRFSKIFMGGIMLLLVVGLAGFGAVNFGGRAETVGRVGDIELDINRYARALNAEMRSFQEQIGQAITFEQARQFGIEGAALRQLILDATIDNETSRLGLSVGDAEIQRQLLATAGFRGSDGEFDRAAYEFNLQNIGLSVSEYEDSLRRLTAANILQSAVISGMPPSETFSDALVGYLGERREFSWLKLDEQNLRSPVPTPNEADLLAYFESNRDDYTLPASKQITYAWLSPAFVINQVDISDDELRAQYDERSSEFNIPERRLIERMVFATAAEADAAVASIRSGQTSFNDVVAARGLELSDIDLGPVSLEALGTWGDAAFALTEPGITDALETELGPGFYRVNGIFPPRSTPFEAVRDLLLAEEAIIGARALIAGQFNELDDLLAGGVTLEEVVAESEMQLGQIDWVAPTEDGIGAFAGFAAAADLVTTDDFPAIDTLLDGGIFALRLDGALEERPDVFANVREEVIADWSAAELTRTLQDQASEILTELSGGAPLSSFDLPVSTETNIKRDAVFPDVPLDFLDSVFELEVGSSTSVSDAGQVIVVRLSNVLDADPLDPDRDSLRGAINNSVEQAIGLDAFEAFGRALQQEVTISLDQNAINLVNSQFASTGTFQQPSGGGDMAGGHPGGGDEGGDAGHN